MATIHHQVWTSAPAATIYSAITHPEAIGTWWAPQTATHTADGVILEYFPGPAHGVVRLKVRQLVPDRRVEWECVSTHPRTSPAFGWTGTRISFEIYERVLPSWAQPAGVDGPTTTRVLDFSHAGWDDNSEYLGFCSFAWAGMLEKLKQVCESPQS
jgi:uncharacterized protein YndB with AHSA1/START domain